jgi:hypothetical protein
LLSSLGDALLRQGFGGQAKQWIGAATLPSGWAST